MNKSDKLIIIGLLNKSIKELERIIFKSDDFEYNNVLKTSIIKSKRIIKKLSK